jgi:hypothetical protein|tara:strand:+ start:406 stop:1242 length:837 start_codon:yes stop_codon:yes gene_type:complete
MIRIDKMTAGRFGNRVLHYNNLMQLATTLNTGASCVFWEGHECFSDLVGQTDWENPVDTVLDWKTVLGSDDISDNAQLGPYCLHNVFLKLTKTDPRQFIKVNEKYKVNLPEDKVNVGIHIRGTDILGADGNQGREIHSPEYYRNAIDAVESEFENTKYYICTDDTDFISFKETVKHLTKNEIEYEVGSPNHFLDFATLSECDVIIASSSTFTVAAGFTGKKDKKIIHSMEWIQRNLDHTLWHPYDDPKETRKWQLSYDNFWTDLYEGGNEFYHAWKFI